MKERKFKVGDRVKAIKSYDGNDDIIGKRGTIKYIGYTSTPYAVEFDEDIDGHDCNDHTKFKHGWWCTEDVLEKVNNETIVIYCKGNNVIAKNKVTGKQAIATCSPEDDFDFNIGAKLAFNRLMNNGIVEVHRKAKIGEYVKIVDAEYVPVNDDGTPSYKNGDILKIIEIHFGRPCFRKGVDKTNRAYVLNGSEYVVLEGYKPKLKSIKIGDQVRVIDDGKIYSTYIDWVKQNIKGHLKYEYDYGHDADKSHTFKVEQMAKHSNYNDTMLAYIQDLSTDCCYVIGIEGLEKC